MATKQQQHQERELEIEVDDLQRQVEEARRHVERLKKPRVEGDEEEGDAKAPDDDDDDAPDKANELKTEIDDLQRQVDAARAQVAAARGTSKPSPSPTADEPSNAQRNARVLGALTAVIDVILDYALIATVADLPCNGPVPVFVVSLVLRALWLSGSLLHAPSRFVNPFFVLFRLARPNSTEFLRQLMAAEETFRFKLWRLGDMVANELLQSIFLVSLLNLQLAREESVSETARAKAFMGLFIGTWHVYMGVSRLPLALKCWKRHETTGGPSKRACMYEFRVILGFLLANFWMAFYITLLAGTSIFPGEYCCHDVCLCNQRPTGFTQTSTCLPCELSVDVNGARRVHTCAN